MPLAPKRDQSRNRQYTNGAGHLTMFPRLVRVRQHFADRKIADIPGTICQELSKSKFGAHLLPGSNIAIGVGSRGIANIATIVYSIVAFWKEKGMQPFIFPAISSSRKD